MQLSPWGPVLTVERYSLAVMVSTGLFLTLDQFGFRKWAMFFKASTAALTVGVRVVMWLLMNWK